uniref:Uncharacterized protein n=1 Tax=Bouteloua dactyloides TaxID=160577 RepID=A0A679EI77_9POAL|nr:hypothetical protein [Bouteloua dactyloides]
MASSDASSVASNSPAPSWEWEKSPPSSPLKPMTAEQIAALDEWENDPIHLEMQTPPRQPNWRVEVPPAPPSPRPPKKARKGPAGPSEEHSSAEEADEDEDEDEDADSEASAENSEDVDREAADIAEDDDQGPTDPESYSTPSDDDGGEEGSSDSDSIWSSDRIPQPKESKD